MEAAAEQEGGGDAFDDGNLDEYTDSEYVDEDSNEPVTSSLATSRNTVMGANDITIFGALTAKQKAALKKHLDSILKNATISGDWESGEGGDSAWEAGEGGAGAWERGEGDAMDLDDGDSAAVSMSAHPGGRVRGIDRMRARRAARE